MPNLEKGTIVAQGECSCCGKPVKIKLNKNGTAYYFCPWVDAEGERCNSQRRWGRTISQQMQRDYLAARRAEKEQHGKPSDLQDHTKDRRRADRSTDDGDIFARFG